ncbi:hypothetical protein ACC687_40920, partial [Rhizobium ruizarguesonis]
DNPFDWDEYLHVVLPSGETGFRDFLENARSGAAPIFEWRHGYAFFLQIQRFHDAGRRFPWGRR